MKGLKVAEGEIGFADIFYALVCPKCYLGSSFCSFLGLLTLIRDTFRWMDWVISKFSISRTLRF